MLRCIPLAIGLCTLLTLVYLTESCNEAICASVVSKCMLTQSCKCDLTNCTCCKECYNCLGSFYSECCECVEICPKSNATRGLFNNVSHVGDLAEFSTPSLFRALTIEPDLKHEWDSYTFVNDISAYMPKLDKEIKYHTQSAEQEVAPVKNGVAGNCTVAFVVHCHPWAKCRVKCLSMGASSYRWFHDGCCECIGPNCINYGINESRCAECPPPMEDLPVNGLDEYDYGDED